MNYIKFQENLVKFTNKQVQFFKINKIKSYKLAV